MMNKQAVWFAPDELAELRRLANAALTCAPSQCVREQVCCDLAQGVLMRLPPPMSTPPEPDEDPDEVAFYAPDWEAPRAPDWSAA